MLMCRELSEQASEFLEGRMTWRDRGASWLHIMMCRHCRRYLHQLRLAIAALAQMRRPPSPVDVSSVLAALGKER
jgi:hypothetical protein